MDRTIPHDLVFDDEPLDSILYGAACQEATPADILEFCRSREDLPPECFDAVAAILAQDPGKGMSLESRRLERIVDHVQQSLAPENGDYPRKLLTLARICHAAGHLEQAEVAYRQALKYRNGHEQLLLEDRQQAMNNLSGLLDQMGRAEDAKEERMLCKGEMLLADGASGGLVTVRSLALDLYLAGRNKAAERLYRGLLALRFQQPGTLIHLARVLLMQDRLPEARKAVSDAWKRMRNREVLLETPPYVPSRIIFFRMFFAMLARANYSRLVAGLKQELLGNSSRESWTIDPVIAHFKQYLRPGDVEFLEAVAVAINSAENMEKLNAFPVWSDGDSSLQRQA